MPEAGETDGARANRLALLIHDGPVQVLSAAALRLELVARRLSEPDAGEVLRAVEDVRAAVFEIQQHTSAHGESDGA